MEEELRQRRFANVVRSNTGQANQWMLNFLARELQVDARRLYQLPAETELRRF